MKINPEKIHQSNQALITNHTSNFNFLRDRLEREGVAVQPIIEKLKTFQIAIPSWALGAGGTRFGRFSIGGEPVNLEQKIDDVGILHALTQSAGAISLHIPWDIPKDPVATKEQAALHGIVFDAVNSNTFQELVHKLDILC